MKLPGGHQAIIPRAKIDHYLLAPNHPVGGAKARFFVERGYDPAYPEILLEDLQTVAVQGTVTETIQTEYGIKFIVDGELDAPNGTRARLRTIWFLEPGSRKPRFVTAYPR